jgi:hypothetical protein
MMIPHRKNADDASPATFLWYQSYISATLEEDENGVSSKNSRTLVLRQWHRDDGCGFHPPAHGTSSCLSDIERQIAL